MSGATRGSCQDALGCRCSDTEDTTVDHSGRHSARTNNWTSARPHHRDPSPTQPATTSDSIQGRTTPSTTTALYQAILYICNSSPQLPLSPRLPFDSIRVCAIPRQPVKAPSPLSKLEVSPPDLDRAISPSTTTPSPRVCRTTTPSQCQL